MKKMIQLTFTLTVIAALAGVSIASVYEKTKDIISEQKVAHLNSALESLFPAGVAISEDSLILQDSSSVRFWIAERTGFMEKKSVESDSPILGYAIESGSYGYSSTVKCITAVTTSGEILGLSILSQEETPGLGSRSTESVSDLTFWNGLFRKKEKREPWFQSQFRGLNVMDSIKITTGAEWHTLDSLGQNSLLEKNQVSAITGATITTRAVTNSLGNLANIVKEINSYLASNGDIQ